MVVERERRDFRRGFHALQNITPIVSVVDVGQEACEGAGRMIEIAVGPECAKSSEVTHLKGSVDEVCVEADAFSRQPEFREYQLGY